jgi:hypothetical protein
MRDETGGEILYQENDRQGGVDDTFEKRVHEYVSSE